MDHFLGRKKTFSQSEKLEVDYLLGPKKPGEFNLALLQTYGPEVTLEQALAWVRINAFSDAMIHEMRWVFGENDMMTVWRSLMLHRNPLKSAWKREIKDFHKLLGVRAHPALLMLDEAYIGGLQIPVHDKDMVRKHLVPLLGATSAVGVDFAQKENDYHEWIVNMLEKAGVKIPRRLRAPAPTRPSPEEQR